MTTKRTYYCVEHGCPSYPVNEVRAQTRPFADPQTNALAFRVRAASQAEAIRLVTDRLTAEREEAIAATQGGIY